MSRTPFLAASTLALSLMASGCASVPDLGSPAALRTAETIAASESLPGAGSAWPGEDWWVGYDDPQLAGLIEEGLRNAPDVAAAAARLRRAAGLAQQAGGALLPSVDVRGQGGLNKQSYNNGLPKEFVPKGWLDTGQVVLDLNFDLDLWGKNRAALAAATSEVRAAEIDAQQARLMLTTSIADAYADLARLHAERAIQQRTLELRIATQTLVAQREQNGLETRSSVRQADATASSARANVAAADEAIALRQNQIAALIGAGPDRGLAMTAPRLGALVAQGLPSDVTTDLIGRRPDIAAARARAEAAASRIKVARADFFPALRLSGLIGFQALGLDQLLEKDALYGNVGPAISLPIFHGGSIKGQYRGARATYDEAVANYDAIVLDAYRDVADAVASRRILTQRLVDVRAALAASEDAYAIARQRYDGGLSTYLDVLNIEDRLLAVRQASADLDARAFVLDVALIRALGGGFTITDAHFAKDNSHG
ncbi:NodT family efflux transporter outer membrane factor (OMF) lipoprotein [Sphingobium boeckii]|uniref:NodT family efflux transporter outer membrane factor (OMF) lipoprotein n=1 Tax=Sphingobium boeckii TaxID=1082345 RepID=A0A7W9EDM5_9SPHN|nr:NodT family efflux transporter outer membrane factor (OMF) lipoprotein [Sphingobium boeckii]